MIKLIASDIDGTLIQDNSQRLWPQIYPLIEKLSNLGIQFVAASGRQYPNLHWLFAPVQQHMTYICENGCLVRKDGKTLYKAKMQEELAQKILHRIWEKDTAELLLSGEDTSYIKPKSQKYLTLLRDVVKNKVTVVDDIFTLREDPFKISVYEEAGIEAAQEYWQNAFPGEVTAVTSGFEWLDFTPIGANKGTALKHLQETLGIAPDECMAFGDEYNDIEMLQNVRYSYAMNTAKPGVKEISRYTVDRVEYVLEELLKREGQWEDKL